MMKEIFKYKTYIIILVVAMMVASLFLSVNYLMKDKKNNNLPEVRLRKTNENKTFAIMVQNGDGYEEYVSKDNTWPGLGYVFKEAKCINNNGDLVVDALTFANKKATLTTNQTVYCTLYFDEKPDPAKDLRVNDPNGNLSEDLQGGMYRYQGTDDVPNWICFGTNSKDECTNEDTGIDKYMYRIIGITEEKQLYLIKETFLKEGESTTFAWNNKYSTAGSYVYTCDNKICPDWPQSLLFKRINGTSNGEIPGTGTAGNNANTDIFVDSSQYDYLKSGDKDGVNGGESPSEWYNLIADHEWMYGDMVDIGNTSPVISFNGQTLYEIETGQADVKHYVGTEGSNVEQIYRWNQKVTGKISLMYIHDYFYGYYDGSSEESRGNAGNYGYGKLRTSWLFFQKDEYNLTPNYEWLSTRRGIRSESDALVDAFTVYAGGSWDRWYLHIACGVRPVFYLKSSAKIVSGKGTKIDPYILDLTKDSF